MIVSDTSCKIHLVIVNPTWIKGRKKGSCRLHQALGVSLQNTLSSVVKPARFCRRPAPAPALPRRRSTSVTSSTDKTDPKFLPGPARPYCPRRTGIVQTPVPSSRASGQLEPCDSRRESRSLSQSRNSDNEYFASVFKLARFCRAACVLPHRRPAPGPPSHGWRRLRRPCPVAAGRRACPADFEQVAVNCQPEGSGRRRAGCRAVTRTQLGLPARRRTTAAVTAKVRVASVAGCPSQGQCSCCSALQAGKT
jgi:hypothetical protein